MNTVCNGLYILSTFMFEIYDFAFVFCVFYYFLFKMGRGGGLYCFHLMKGMIVSLSFLFVIINFVISFI